MPVRYQGNDVPFHMSRQELHARIGELQAIVDSYYHIKAQFPDNTEAFMREIVDGRLNELKVALRDQVCGPSQGLPRDDFYPPSSVKPSA